MSILKKLAQGKKKVDVNTPLLKDGSEQGSPMLRNMRMSKNFTMKVQERSPEKVSSSSSDVD
jgi:hypothetical protein